MSKNVHPSRLPIILVPSCRRTLGHHPFHVVGKKYIDAVRLAGGLPWVVPDASAAELVELIELADGVLLTGSPSNVHPSHFGEPVEDPSLPLDTERDGWTLPLIRAAIERGIPLLGICRGFQEVNVALGGTLHQAVHKVPGLMDHRPQDESTAELQYGVAHTVEVRAGGVLAGLFAVGRQLHVNSLHGQGVRELAPGLQVEALAPDGVIEAFSLPAAIGFNLCLQWHPEWQAATNPVSQPIFTAFGQACAEYHESHRLDRHRGPEPDR